MTGTLILFSVALLADDGWRPATDRTVRHVEYADFPALPADDCPAPLAGSRVIVERPAGSQRVGNSSGAVVTQRPESDSGWRPAGRLVPYERAGTRAARQRWTALRLQLPDDGDELPPSPYPADWEHSDLPLPGPVAEEEPPASIEPPASAIAGRKATVRFPDDSGTVLDSGEDVRPAKNTAKKQDAKPPAATDEQTAKKKPSSEAVGERLSKNMGGTTAGRQEGEKPTRGKTPVATATDDEENATTSQGDRAAKEKKGKEPVSPSGPKAESAAAASQLPTFTLLGLFGSLGANAFLILVTLGQRNRYRAVVRRMKDGLEG